MNMNNNTNNKDIKSYQTRSLVAADASDDDAVDVAEKGWKKKKGHGPFVVGIVVLVFFGFIALFAGRSGNVSSEELVLGVRHSSLMVSDDMMDQRSCEAKQTDDCHADSACINPYDGKVGRCDECPGNRCWERWTQDVSGIDYLFGRYYNQMCFCKTEDGSDDDSTDDDYDDDEFVMFDNDEQFRYEGEIDFLTDRVTEPSRVSI